MQEALKGLLMQTEKELSFDLLNAIAKLVVVLASCPLSVLLYGWALAKLWIWFAVPTFHLPALSITYALGLSLIVRLTTYQTDAVREDAYKKSTWGSIGLRIAKSAFLSLGAVGMGWLILWLSG
jgi:hypothetical protein